MIEAGTKFGPYEIIAPLGAGGMGEVYRARDKRLDRTVAIKLLASHLSSSPELKQRFEREARAISSLQHPNICTLYDVGSQDGVDFLVMEYLEGQTLAHRLNKGALPVQEALKIGTDIADALEKAHKAGITHRDLKPGNVMLTKSGAKLLDFGLAKPAAMAAGVAAAPLVSAAMTLDVPHPELSPLTSHGMIVGTIQYMSPEQIEGKEADARSDIFSFGSMLYEMATGKPAFRGKTQLSVASAILEKEPEPLSTVRPTSPPALDYVIRTCLAKNPEERYQSAADVGLQLRWVAQQSNTTKILPRSSRRLLVTTVVSMCMVVAIAGWWLGSRSSGMKPEPMHVTVPVVPGSLGETLTTPAMVSPDGRWLLYLVERDGQHKLYLRAFTEAEGKILDGSAGAAGPFFSPDSRWIAFAANHTLKKVPVSGGSPTKICNVIVTDDSLGFLGGAWSPDGRIVFVPGFNSGLWEVPATGGTPKLLLATDVSKDRVAVTHPQVLPDGKGILFTSVPNKARDWDDERIAVLEPGASEPRIVVQGGSNARYLPTGHLVYGHAGSLVAVRFNLARLAVEGTAVPVVRSVHPGFPDPLYSVSENGTLIYVPWMKVANPRLFVMDRKGNRRAITDGSENPEDLAVSPDGKTIVARVVAANDDLWTFDTIRGTPLRLTFEPGDEIYPQWTPDGKRIAYGTRTGTIYWRRADGSGQREELSKGKFPRYPSSFSPDGKWLAIVEATINRGRDIWIIPIGGGDRKPIPFETTDADEWSPKFSSDGRFIAYVSNESGTTEIYIRPFGGSGGRRRITSSGGLLPVWSRTGRELFFVRGATLMSVGIDANGNASTSEHLVLDTAATGDVLDSKATVYDVMPDGQHFVISLAPPSTTPPYYELIVNWFEEVNRLTAR
jgi:serine/threonine protein kinase/Tol biopolymer transport system component